MFFIIFYTSLAFYPRGFARRYKADNLLSRGQEIAFETDPDPRDIVRAVLRPGEFTLFNVRLAHSSPPNTSDDRRIGLAVRCVAVVSFCAPTYHITAILNTVNIFMSELAVRCGSRFSSVKSERER